MPWAFAKDVKLDNQLHNLMVKGALEGAEPVTCRYKSITTAVLSIVPFEQSTR